MKIIAKNKSVYDWFHDYFKVFWNLFGHSTGHQILPFEKITLPLGIFMDYPKLYDNSNKGLQRF